MFLARDMAPDALPALLSTIPNRSDATQPKLVEIVRSASCEIGKSDMSRAGVLVPIMNAVYPVTSQWTSVCPKIQSSAFVVNGRSVTKVECKDHCCLEMTC